MGLPHLTLDLREEFRAGVVSPFLDDHAAGLTPNPCVRCNGHVRLDAMIDLARRARAPTRSRPATTPASPATRDGPLLRARRRPGEGPELHARRAGAGVARAACASPSASWPSRACASSAAEAGLPVADKPDSQDLCFLAGTDRSTFLARHGGIRPRPGRSSTAVDARSGATAATTASRSASAAGSASPPRRRSTSSTRTPAANRVVVGPREALRRTSVAVRAAVLHRDAARVDRVKLRYRSEPLAARRRRRCAGGRHDRLELELREPVLGAAPGQAAVLMDGELVVGHGTIAAY